MQEWAPPPRARWRARRSACPQLAARGRGRPVQDKYSSAQAASGTRKGGCRCSHAWRGGICTLVSIKMPPHAIINVQEQSVFWVSNDARGPAARNGQLYMGGNDTDALYTVITGTGSNRGDGALRPLPRGRRMLLQLRRGVAEDSEGSGGRAGVSPYPRAPRG